MQGFYNITTKIKETLALDDFVNTVTYGDIFEIDLNKQDIFPLSHFIVNSATLNGSVWQFNMSLLCMDIVDESKEDVTDKFLGNDNEQDVLNTQMAVINRLLELLRRGDLHTELYQLEGSPTIEAFFDRFENKLAGWTLTFDVLIPNDMTIC
jgi:oligoribonuclease NrnB/cAMP/cGMP phosphodiesterase (DHH superfamily)